MSGRAAKGTAQPPMLDTYRPETASSRAAPAPATIKRIDAGRAGAGPRPPQLEATPIASGPVKHVHRIVKPDGSVHLYLRKAGLPRVRLRSAWPEPGSETGSSLEREVAGLVASLSPKASTPGTLSAYLRAYELEDARYAVLDASTKAEYRRYLAEFEEQLGALRVAAFTPAFVEKLRDAWAARGHRAANLRRQVLKNVLLRARIEGELMGDPFDLVGEIARPRTLAEPHIIWPESVVETVIEAAIAQRLYGLARGVAIGRYAGPRRADIVSIPRAARQHGRLRFLSGKRRVQVDILEDPALTRWLAATPEAQPFTAGQLKTRRLAKIAQLPPITLVFNTRGRPYSEDGFGQELAKLVGDLAKAGAIGSADYDLHGLRHTLGVELALAGCTDAQGAAMLGHSSPHSFAQYRRQADRIRLAEDGSAKLATFRERTRNGNVETKVETGCKPVPLVPKS